MRTRSYALLALTLCASACSKSSTDAAPAGTTAPTGNAAAPAPTAAAAPVVIAFPDRPLVTVRVEDLVKEYRNNRARADERFKSKLVQIQGKVSAVEKDPSGEVYVAIGTGAEPETALAECFVKKGEEKALADLKKGDVLAAAGRVEGLVKNVVAKECVINPDLQLCERVRAVMGIGECKRHDPDNTATLQVSEKSGIVPTCVATRDQYDRMVGKSMSGDEGMKAVTVGSEKNLCVGIVVSDTDPAELARKAAAALATL